MPDENDTARRARLGKLAERQGYVLKWWRASDPRVKTYGLYYLVDFDPERASKGMKNDIQGFRTLDQVEDWLTGIPQPWGKWKDPTGPRGSESL